MQGLACPASTCVSLLPAVFFLFGKNLQSFSPLLLPVARLRILESKRPYNPLKPIFFFLSHGEGEAQRGKLAQPEREEPGAAVPSPTLGFVPCSTAQGLTR